LDDAGREEVLMVEGQKELEPLARIKGGYSREFYRSVVGVLNLADPSEVPTIVEIGTRMGEWIKGLRYHTAARVFAIDPWPRRARRGLVSTFPQWFENLKPWAFLDVHPIRGTSQEWGRCWPEELRPHVVFVDGDHHRDAVSDDGVIWWRLLRPGGAIYFHDAGERGVSNGLSDFLDTLPPEVAAQISEAQWGPGDVATKYLRKPDVDSSTT
jgi:hypothetical protein